jgi:hypothetical protein
MIQNTCKYYHKLIIYQDIKFCYRILDHYSLLYLIHQVYKIGKNVNATLSLLSLGPERKVKFYSGYFVNGYMFHTEEYGQGTKT